MTRETTASAGRLRRSRPTLCIWFVWLCATSVSLIAQEQETRFVDELYPAFLKVQCQLCHNDNGVASGYTLEFPPAGASREQVLAFGYQLTEFVDKAKPDDSVLLTNPTGRTEHTGGIRIQPGSPEETALKSWVQYLAQMSASDQQRAEQLIVRANQWKSQPVLLQRLTHSQYNHTVRDLLGDDTQPAEQFPKEDFVRGFKNQLEGQGISPLLGESYSQAAERLARSAFRGGDQHHLIPVIPTSVSDRDAANQFVTNFGRRAFRRPLSPGESSKYVELLIAESSSSSESVESAFLGGATLVVEAMLQSPHFLYRRNPNYEQASNPSTVAANQFAQASRLSYVLWDTMPDETLMKLAADGELSGPAQIEAQVRRMMNDPRFDQSLHEFLSQWLRTDRVLSATRDRRRFREFNTEVASAMVEETQRLFDHLVKNDLNFMEFFTADYTFVNAQLARIYNLPEPAEEFQAVRYPAESTRSGVLGHGSFLVSTSKPAETSPTARGVFIRNQFLAQEIAPPPPGVNAVLPEIAEDKLLTNRQRLEVHLNSEACASCHRLIDPIGLSLEQYDAIGAYHEKVQFRFGTRENPVIKELEVDTSAFVAGMADSQFAHPKELGRLLAGSETCQRCIVKQYFRFVMGREETAADGPLIDDVFARFRDSGFQFRELVAAMLVQTSGFHGG